MYCTKCGKEVADGTTICEECREGRLEKEQKKKFGKWIGITAIAIMIIAIIGTIIARPKSIDLSKYVIVDITGYDGYGKASWEFDRKNFKKDYGEKLKLTKKAQEENMGLFSPEDFVEYVFDGELNKSDHLSNGETITFSWKEISDEEVGKIFKNKFKRKEVSVEVNDLEQIETFDAFENIEIEYIGCEPTAEAKVLNQAKDTFLQGLSYEIDNGLNLSNGDVISVRVYSQNQKELEAYCAEEYGKVPKTTVKEFTVEGLNKYVTAVDQIPEETLNKMKAEVEDHLRAQSVTWQKEVTLENVTYIGAYALNQKEGRNSRNNKIYLVYKIGVHEDFTEEGVDNHINYYYYGRYDDVMLLADGTCSVDLSKMQECKNTFTRALDIWKRDLFFSTQKKLRYYGYENLESMFNTCVTADLADYTYISTVEDVEIEIPSEDVEMEILSEEEN